MTRILARSTFIVLAFCLLGSTAAPAETKEVAALQAARDWLAIVDAGHYDESWFKAARYFKSAVNKEQWRQAVAGVRQPLGKVLARELNSKTYATELPGAPDGEYFVIQFNTAFEKKRAAIETVTPMLEAGGKWSVAGYFIR